MKTTINEIIAVLKSNPDRTTVIKTEVRLNGVKWTLEALVNTIDSMESEWKECGSMASAGLCHIRTELKKIIGDE